MTTARIHMTVAALVAAMALMLATALPAAAHGGHTSCRGFGAEYVVWAQGGYVEFDLSNPGLGPFASAGPRVIAEIIAHEHEDFC